MPARLFDQTTTTEDLNALLREAGFDPADAQVEAIKQVISRYYAGRTAEVLQRVQEVLSRFSGDNDNT